MLLPLLLALACSNADKSAGSDASDIVTRAPAKPASVAGLPEQVTASGLKSWVLTPGTGAQPKPGQIVRVHYTGWLKDGTQFDSSAGGDPLTFRLGIGKVIAGWDEGIGLMKVGEKRQLEIPPELGYGDRGAGGVIPPGATLVFDVELVGIEG